MIKKLFYDTFIEAEREREEYSLQNKSLDTRSITICVLTAFSLCMIYYFGRYNFLKSFLSDIGADGILTKIDQIIYNSSNNFPDLCYWVFVLIFFYFVVPALIIKLIFKENLSDYGLKWKGAFEGYYLYIVMLLIMIPLVIYFSSTRSFQERYPFLNINPGHPLGVDFWKWEFLYCAQFFALEFFFRGFVLHGLKRRFGFYSVFIMTIPYCMIHFQKPLPEALAAIIAGIVLGCLSLKSRSILLGFLIHVSVGLGMDLAAIMQKGFFH